MRERALDEDVPGRGLLGHERVQPGGVPRQSVGHPAVRDDLDRSADGVEALALERLDLEEEPVGERHVVRVHPGEQPSARLAPRPLERCDDPGRRLPHEPEARVSRGVRGRELRRRVARAVVHDDDLEVGERLRRERAERLGEERLAVPHGQEDGHERRHATNPRAARRPGRGLARDPAVWQDRGYRCAAARSASGSVAGTGCALRTTLSAFVVAASAKTS